MFNLLKNEIYLGLKGMNEMNIMYTLNDGFVPQVGAGIVSVCENNRSIKEITFFLISYGIKEKNKKLLKKLVFKYKRNIEIIELKSLDEYFDFDFDTFGWNPIVLARLLVDQLIPKNINKILYLDGDTIVRGCLEELWDTKLNDKTFAMSIEPTVDRKRKCDLGLEKYPYYNAGVILMNLERFRKINASKIIIDYYREHDGKLFANDQDAINASMKDEILTVSPKYNFYNIFYQYPYSFMKKLMDDVPYIEKDVYLDAVKNPCIIHYLGEERPWRIGNHHRYRDDYLKYLDMTPWKGMNMENGWKFYFVCWTIFNVVTKSFPNLRYHIINALIPKFMKHRSKKIKREAKS